MAKWSQSRKFPRQDNCLKIMNTQDLQRILDSNIYTRQPGICQVLARHQSPFFINRAKTVGININTYPCSQPGVSLGSLGLY